MIIAEVSFEPVDLPPEASTALVEESVPRWRGVPGLVRKYYVHDADRRRVSGIYLWESREHAEAAYTPVWAARMTERLGVEPEIAYAACVAVLDNRFDEVLTPQARAG